VNCNTCKFWSPVPHKLDFRGYSVTNQADALKPENCAGECRRYPPRSAASVGGGYRAFPITRYVDGCGEHKAVIAVEKEYCLPPIEIPITEVKKLGRPKKVVDDKDSQG